jgi:hypothetical protein
MSCDGAISIRGGAGYARFPRQPLAKLVVSLPYVLTQNVPASSLIMAQVTDRIVCRLAFDPSSCGERWRLVLFVEVGGWQETTAHKPKAKAKPTTRTLILGSRILIPA